MIRSAQLTLASLAGLLVLTGCAAGTASYPTGGQRAGGAVTVEVQNNNQEDMEVYVSRNGTRSRLGTVLRHDSGSFTLQGATLPVSGRLQFALQPFGTSSYFVTEAVHIQSGDIVVLNIGPDMSLTRVDVRR